MHDEELRLAVVLNGGVSLSVWMGGVTNEFAQLMGEVPDGELPSTASVFERLRKLLGTRVRIDIICGTSAGGINGAFLGLAIARHGQRAGEHTSALREVWTRHGSMAALLRNPFSETPPSVLDGDGTFRRAIRSALDAIPAGSRSDRGEPLAVVMTTTLVRGTRKEVSDVFGNRLTEICHRGTFQFIRGEEGPDPFEGPQAVDRLEVAARSTASFPGAFEPHFVVVGKNPANASGPDMEGIADFPTSGFATDGGVLDNSPIGRALDLVFRQRAGGPVRRVMAFVVPDPSVAPETPAADPAAAPGMLEVAFDAMVRIPRVQGISGQIEELRQHNETVRQRRRDRVLLTRTVSSPDLAHVAATLFETYRAQRVQSAARQIVDRIDQRLATMEADGLGRRGRRAWLISILTDLGPSLPFVPTVPPGSPTGAGERQQSTWRWGTLPVQHMARIFLDLVGRTQRVANLVATPPELLPHWRAAFVAIEDIDRARAIDRGRWPELATELRRLLGGPSNARGTAEARRYVTDAVERWRHEPPATTSGTGIAPSAGEVAFRIAAGIIALTKASAPLLGGMAVPTDAVVKREVEDLRGLTAYFCRGDDDTIPDVIDRLLVLEVVQEASGPTNVDVEQEVDYVQVSADSPTLFGGPPAVEDRLTGLQLAHFGAFYKGSWRANDWMWGRLDAVGRLVLMLLDPSRLTAISRRWPQGERARRLTGELRSIALGDPSEAIYATLLREFDDERLIEELGFLDDPERLMPERLVEVATVLTRRLQLEILLEELPHVAEQLRVDLQAERGSEEIRRLLAKIESARLGNSLDSSKVRGILSDYCVGSQRLVDEIGNDRLSLLATQAVAVSISALRRETASFRMLSSTLTTLRFPALAAHILIRNATIGSRGASGFNMAALAVGATIIGTHFIAEKGVYPGWIVAVSAFVIAVGIGRSLARERIPTRLVVGGFGMACVLGGLLIAIGRIDAPTIGVDTGRVLLSIVLFVFGGLLMRFAERFRQRGKQ